MGAAYIYYILYLCFIHFEWITNIYTNIIVTVYKYTVIDLVAFKYAYVIIYEIGDLQNDNLTFMG